MLSLPLTPTTICRSRQLRVPAMSITSTAATWSNLSPSVSISLVFKTCSGLHRPQGPQAFLPSLAPASCGSFHTGPLAPSWLRAFARAVAPLPRPTLPLSLYSTSLMSVLVCSRPHPVGTPPRPGVGTEFPGCQVHVEGEGSEGLSCEGSSMALTGGSRNLWPRGECVGCSALCQPLTWPHGQHCGCVPWATGSPAWHTALGTS